MNRERDLDVAAHAPRRAHRPSKRHRKLPHRLRVIEQGTRARLAHARRAHKFEYNRDDRHAPSVRHAHERTSRGERRCPYPRRRDEDSVRARPMGGMRGRAASLGACKQQRSSSLHMPRPRAQIAEPPANGPSAWEEVRAHTDDNGRFDREGALQLERNRTERSRPRARAANDRHARGGRRGGPRSARASGRRLDVLTLVCRRARQRRSIHVVRHQPRRPTCGRLVRDAEDAGLERRRP